MVYGLQYCWEYNAINDQPTNSRIGTELNIGTEIFMREFYLNSIIF